MGHVPMSDMSHSEDEVSVLQHVLRGVGWGKGQR